MWEMRFVSCLGTFSLVTGDNIFSGSSLERVNNKYAKAAIPALQLFHYYRLYNNITTGLEPHIRVSRDVVRNWTPEMATMLPTHVQRMGLNKRVRDQVR